jgi:stage V sporulation protein AE
LTDIILPLVKAFVVGGLICTVGQLLIDFTKMTPAKILVSFVVIGVALGGLGIYEPLVKWAGSGATLPLTGFGYALAKGTKEAVMKDGLLGALSGPLASSSVGIMAAVISGLIASVFARSKDK